ncbi:hypothetical protein FZEAL_8416 [Fusarium zealandicum]|uniref:Heterokaryon incompatibility domain-containing protein n=1 Tax=Fusarium zealandicum TaxID=1053134 RepID=A0A8H4UEI8_9HYPO|nr:hypothetical protein FZEAL_8416 [Fusarium zealandicum]
MRLGLGINHQLVFKPAHLAGAATLIALIANTHRIRLALSRLSFSLQNSVSETIFKVSHYLFGFLYSDTIGNQHIRLLRLPDADSSCPPQLTLHTFALDECPPYLAISYTWGPYRDDPSLYLPCKLRSILFNGKPFAVLPNLHDALSQMCMSRPGHYLWVDSICINQTSLAERSAQIAIIDYIYNGTVETVIWLGPSSDSTARAIEVARLLATDAHVKILQWERNQILGDFFIADDPDMLARNGLPSLSADDWTVLEGIYTRAWFRRVWMLQEVALSRNPNVLIGAHEVPWEVLGDAASVAGISGALIGLLALGGGRPNIPLVQGLHHAVDLQMIREWRLGQDSRYREVLNSQEFTAGSKREHPSKILQQLLLGTNRLKATFRRDRFYALLGVANHMVRM